MQVITRGSAGPKLSTDPQAIERNKLNPRPPSLSLSERDFGTRLAEHPAGYFREFSLGDLSRVPSRCLSRLHRLNDRREDLLADELRFHCHASEVETPATVLPWATTCRWCVRQSSSLS